VGVIQHEQSAKNVTILIVHNVQQLGMNWIILIKRFKDENLRRTSLGTRAVARLTTAAICNNQDQGKIILTRKKK
jgi:hypothetical protein